MTLLSKQEVASRLQCHIKTIKYYISSKQIPFVMIGREAMFLEKSIEKWLKEREQQVILAN